jgi:hypothetical protein
MKEALQAEHEEQAAREASGQPVMIGPNGRPIVTPEDLARKQARDRKLAESKAKARRERVEKLVSNLVNKLSIYTESARGEHDRIVSASFKVGV